MNSPTVPSALPVLRLQPRADHRLRTGHLWVYSNEIDTAHSSLKALEAGDQVVVEDARGKPLGVAYANPNTLICARLLTTDYRQQLDGPWFQARLRSALKLRQALFEQPCYRLVYGESDGLPGLVVDRYGDVLVCQVSTIGMERLFDLVLDALVGMLRPVAVVLRNDASARAIEGLASEVGVVYGALPKAVLLEENGTQFEVPVLDGQQTGWFYDHRINRLAMRPLVADREVLDVFSYIGAWGVQAAAAGAREVTLLDSSEVALDRALDNAARNGCRGRCEAIPGRALSALKDLYALGRKFDVVVVDPPAFIKRRKDIKQGEIGYRRINEAAMRVLRSGGFLVSASCSMHLSGERLQQLVADTARHNRRNLRIIGRGYQGPDHPLHPAIAETAYLKALFCQLG